MVPTASLLREQLAAAWSSRLGPAKTSPPVPGPVLIAGWELLAMKLEEIEEMVLVREPLVFTITRIRRVGARIMSCRAKFALEKLIRS